MAKADPRTLAMAALSRAVADPSPKPLFGTKARPGMFTGSAQTTKQAAELCQREGWLRGTGEYEGKGRTRKEYFRITPEGISEAISHGEAAELLRDMLAALDRWQESLGALRDQVQTAGGLVSQQADVVRKLLDRVAPPDLPSMLKTASGNSSPKTDLRPAAAAPASNDWTDQVVRYLEEYEHRNPYGHCPLPELYHQVAKPRKLSIGQFHDGIRRLVAERRIVWHPFTGAAYQLEEEQYALLAGQEIKYYVQRSSGAR